MSNDRLYLYRGLEQLVADNFGYFFQRVAEAARLTEVSFEPPLGSPLWHQGRPVRLPVDQVIAPLTLQAAQWELEELDFLRSHLSEDASWTLIDVGANVGLFARQVLAQLPQVGRALCYEPSPSNASCLRANLEGLPAEIHTCALGAASADQVLYIEDGNAGNGSLLPEALALATPGSERRATVAVREALGESRAWLELPGPLVYKSDTQGADPWLATQYDPRFWERVDVAIVELWRLPLGKSDAAPATGSVTEGEAERHADGTHSTSPSLHPRHVDLTALARMLDSFPHKATLPSSYAPDPTPQPWTTQQAIDYLQGDDGQFVNLALWR